MYYHYLYEPNYRVPFCLIVLLILEYAIQYLMRDI